MQKSSISIRQAIKSDAPFIAQAVAMAIGDENAIKNYCGEDYITLLTQVAENEKSQYSYTNSLIAEIDGTTAGAVVGYDGAMLHELRATTYSIRQSMGSKSVGRDLVTKQQHLQQAPSRKMLY